MHVARFVAWASPLVAVVGAFLARLTAASWAIDPVIGSAALGYAFLVAGLFIVIGWLARHPLFQVAFSIVFLAFSIAPFTLFIGAGGQAFIVVLGCTTFMDVVAVHNIWDCARRVNGRFVWAAMRRAFWDGLRAGKAGGSRAARTRLVAGLLLVAGLHAGAGMLVAAPSLVATGERTFVISDQQAAAYDLFVYFPDYARIDDTICDILDEVNATISFPLSENRFNLGDASGELAANKTALLNARGIQVEVWPLFEWDEGSYPSLAEIDRWPGLYAKFHDWTVRNNITVEYMMWDIESGGEGVNNSDIRDMPQPFKVLVEQGRAATRLREIHAAWPAVLATVRALGIQCRADGHLMGTTTHTIIEDLFDGDADRQMMDGLPVWDAGDAFDFISMMVYRGCEWGGPPGSRDYVYEYTRLNALANRGTGKPVPVCLGCINYTPYPNITSVVADVHLALAAGATMIRLFQANSWIDGVGTWQTASGNWVYGGPAHGVDGLRDLLLACRVGGTTTHRPGAAQRLALLAGVAQDVLWDLAKPF